MKQHFDNIREQHSQLMRIHRDGDESPDIKSMVASIHKYQNYRVDVHLESFRRSAITPSEWCNNQSSNKRSKN